MKLTTEPIKALIEQYEPFFEKHFALFGVEWNVELTTERDPAYPSSDQIKIKFVGTIAGAEQPVSILIALYDELLLPNTQGRAQGFFIQQANRFQPGPHWGKMSAYVYEIRDQSPSLGDYHDIIMQNIWQKTGFEELYWLLNQWGTE